MDLAGALSEGICKSKAQVLKMISPDEHHKKNIDHMQWNVFINSIIVRTKRRRPETYHYQWALLHLNLLLKEALSLAMELKQQKLLFLILVQEENRF